MEQVRKNSLWYLFYMIFILFMLHRLFFFTPGVFEQIGSCVAYPFLKVKQIVQYPFYMGAAYFDNVEHLQKQIQELQLDKDFLQSQLIEQKALQTFHEQSKDVREFAKRYDHKHKLLAQVLLSSVGSSEDIILVGVGAQQGVYKDHVVLYQDMIIGRVIEVYPWYSKVALITDQRCKIAAQCKRGVTGICCGKNNGQLELNFVPHFKDIQVGDMMLSTGKGLVYPKGFALGKVSSMTSDNVSHFIQAKPLYDINQIEYVYVFVK